MCYKHILVAIDLTVESDILIKKAISIAEPLKAEVSFIHIDVNYADIYTGLIVVNLAETQHNAMESSLNQLKELADKSGYPIKHTIVGSGDLGSELKESIKSHNIDLVVCGHHKDFWSMILSSTKQLLNNMPVDMLVVPLEETE